MTTEDQKPDEIEAVDASADENEVDELAALEDALFAGEEPDLSDTPAEESAPKPAEEVEAVGQEPTPPAADPRVEPTPTPEGMMPWGAYAAKRDKAKELQSEVEELRRFKAEREAREAVEAKLAKPKAMPDPIQDTEGFQKHLGDDLTAMRQEMFLMRAEMAAEREFGHDVVKAAHEAVKAVAASRPDIQARLMAAENPHAEAVKIHREMDILNDPEAYKARIIAEYEAGKAASTPTPAPAPAGQTAAPGNPTNPPLPPNIARVTSVAASNVEPSFEDIENGAFGFG